VVSTCEVAESDPYSRGIGPWQAAARYANFKLGLADTVGTLGSETTPLSNSSLSRSMAEPTVAVWNRARMTDLIGLSVLFFAVGVLVFGILVTTKGACCCLCSPVGRCC
jgi:hypothetical protein